MIEIAVAYELSLNHLADSMEHTETVFAHEMALSQSERDQIFREAERCIRSMYKFMDKAEREAAQIANVNVRDATVAAIEGAICALAGRSPHLPA